MNRLFVYGTLMRGEINHRFLSRGLSAFIGEARTAPLYTLLDLGAFPALVERGASEVAGELWDVDDEVLGACDLIEGHPHFYRRQKIALSDGLKVESYLLVRLARTRGEIRSGSWREHTGRA